MQEKYGFVYIWYDRKHKRFYIGSHWGTEDDGYICSSPWMKQAYKKRSQDFKRKILCRIFDDRKRLYQEEQKWLDMIDPSKIKIGAKSKYYNLNTKVCGGAWFLDDVSRLSISEKLRIANTGKKHSLEHKQKLSERMKGENNPYFGKKHSEETRIKMQLAQAKRTRTPCSEETKQKIKEAQLGKFVSEETRKKISISGRGRKQTQEQILKKCKNYKIITPTNETLTVINLREYCRLNNLHNGHMIAVAKGTMKQHKGYRCEYTDE